MSISAGTVARWFGSFFTSRVMPAFWDFIQCGEFRGMVPLPGW